LISAFFVRRTLIFKAEAYFKKTDSDHPTVYIYSRTVFSKYDINKKNFHVMFGKLFPKILSETRGILPVPEKKVFTVRFQKSVPTINPRMSGSAVRDLKFHGNWYRISVEN